MTQVTLYPTADSECQNDSPNFNNGTADALGTGEEDFTNTKYRTFLKFDLSSIASDQTIISAVLYLTIKAEHSSQTIIKYIKKVDSSWTEAGLTWNNQPATSTIFGSRSFGTGDSGQISFILTPSEIEKYVNGTYTDYGIAIITDTESDDFYQFYSRENGTVGNRPTLVINYETPTSTLYDWQKITRVLPGRPFGTGQDGVYNSATIPTLVNLSCSGTAASTSMTVSSTTLANGNLVLIHQTRGTGAGQWEINRIASGGGTTSLTMQTALKYTYTDSGASQAQIIKIFQYSSVTVPSGTWTIPSNDGNVGGIFVFACSGATTITGTIAGNAPSYLGPGFDGGPSVGRNTLGYAGEGSAGGVVQQNNANGNGGGGGVGGGDAGGGGGGGNGTAGASGESQNGHAGGVGAPTFGLNTLAIMTLAGGGGSGGGDEDGNGSGTGGAGGGIVMIYSRTITITGNIYVYGGYGTAGSNNTGTSGMGGGGGGAGGNILLCGQIVDIGTNKMNLGGGAGGNGGGSGGPELNGQGGAGGAGRLAIYYGFTSSGSTTTAGTSVNTRDMDYIGLTASCLLGVL